jgi:hypothetical protein
MAKYIIKIILAFVMLTALIVGLLLWANYRKQQRAISRQVELDNITSEQEGQYLYSQKFLEQFPIEAEHYFIYYSQAQKSLQVIFKAETSEDFGQLKAIYDDEIKQKLVAIGINLDSMPIEWKIQQ